MATSAYSALRTVDTDPKDHPAHRVHLTPRQREVLALLCEGLPSKLICRRLDISTGTVKAHVAAILREFGVTSRVQAVIAAYRDGMVDDAANAPVHVTHIRRDSPAVLRIY